MSQDIKIVEDEMVYSKEDEVDGLKNALNIKNDPKQILEDEATGPDINEVSIK